MRLRVSLRALVPLLGGVLLPLATWAQTSTIGPMDWKERWDNYVDRTYNWKMVGGVALESAFEQSFSIRKCGRPPYCFPHHIGGSLVRRTARTTIELGAGALLKEDTQRRPSGLPHFKDRVFYALSHAVLAKGPDGEWRPAYSRYAGTLGAVAVSSAWQGHPLTTGRLASSFTWSATNYFQDALFAEFEPDLRRLGARAWRNLRYGVPRR